MVNMSALVLGIQCELITFVFFLVVVRMYLCWYSYLVYMVKLRYATPLGFHMESDMVNLRDIH